MSDIFLLTNEICSRFSKLQFIIITCDIGFTKNCLTNGIKCIVKYYIHCYTCLHVFISAAGPSSTRKQFYIYGFQFLYLTDIKILEPTLFLKT